MVSESQMATCQGGQRRDANSSQGRVRSPRKCLQSLVLCKNSFCGPLFLKHPHALPGPPTALCYVQEQLAASNPDSSLLLALRAPSICSARQACAESVAQTRLRAPGVWSRDSELCTRRDGAWLSPIFSSSLCLAPGSDPESLSEL